MARHGVPNAPALSVHPLRSFSKLSGLRSSHFPFSLFHFPVPLSSLQCAVPRFRALTLLECAVTKTASRKSFRMRRSEKRWGGGGTHFSIFSFPIARLRPSTHFHELRD